MRAKTRKGLAASVAALVAAATLASGGAVTSFAVDGVSTPNSSLGLPTFKGDADPLKNTEGVAYDPSTSYLKSVFDKDVANGAGTDTADEHDFWLDRMLARYGTDPVHEDGAEGFTGPYGWQDGSGNAIGTDAAGNNYGYNNPDGNNYLFTRGRAAFMYTYKPETLGFAGNLAYWDVTDKDGYTITVSADGKDVTLTEDTAQRKQTPSYWKSVHKSADGSLTVTQVKYITNNNVLVTDLTVNSTVARDVTITAVAPLATTPEGDELTGRFAAKNNLTTVYPRFSGNGFTPQDGKLTGTVHVAANGSQRTKVQLGLITDELPDSTTEYEARHTGDLKDPAASYKDSVTAYNRWWYENIPYIETPEANIDKTVFYRWWLGRFNYLDANMPSGPMQYPTSIEGVLGYNNAIDLTVGMFIDDLKWLRNPEYSYGPWLNVGENAGADGQYRDNPADPGNWGASHTQWISEAAWKSYQIHGGSTDIAQKLADYASNDVKGQLKTWDSDGDYLLDTNWNAWTGNDADAVSFDEVSGARLDRAESATEYAGAKAAAEAYRTAGGEENEAKAKEMDEYAAKIKQAVLDNLWDSNDKLIRHQFANGEKQGQQAKYKEINNYTPYFTGLMPAEGDADYKDDYESALRLLADADQHPVFPFATANQADDKLVRELGKNPTNNFSVINSTLYFRTYSEALRKYHADEKGYVTPEMFKQLLYWNAFAHYQGGDNRYTDQNEFWNNASTENGGKVQYRSWIHHTQLGTTNWTMVEDVAGMTTRTDDKLELDPIEIPGWDYFTVNNLSYHGKDVTIVYDKDGKHYGGPAGYSAYIGGKLAFTVDRLAHVVYDPVTGEVSVKDDSGAQVTAHNTAELPTASGVTYTAADRVTDMLAKAGINADNDSESRTNLAQGKAVEATVDADGAKNAVDGSTVNQKFWSTKGSTNATDSLTVDFGKDETIDDVRLYFYATSTSATTSGYAEPSMYRLEYWNGSDWVAIPSQTRTPEVPQANYNRVQFPAVTTSKIRVTVTPQSGYAVGLKEIEAYRTGITAEPAGNVAPTVDPFVKDERIGQVTVSATVKDDGLPNGELTAKWSVKSAPEGGEVTFGNADAITTTAKFSMAGTYVLTLTVSDGERSTDKDLTVNATASDGNVNVAPNATPSASYTATNWYNINTVNDGNVVYNQDEGYSVNAWGTWNENNKASEWLQYDWSQPQRLTSASVAFWYDGGGTMVPKSWKLQYDDGNGNWVDVPLQAGTDYPSKGDQMNTVRFARTITTSKLRATFNASGSYYSIAVSEFEAYAEDPLSIDRTAVFAEPGKTPDLPKTVSAAYGDGSRADLPVTWDKVDAAQLTDGAKVSIEGKVQGATKYAELTIYVNSRAGDTPTNLEAEVPEQFVYQNADKSRLQLPATIIVGYNNGQHRNLPVTWNAGEIEALDLSRLGTTEIHGTIEGAENLDPVVKVTVIAANGSTPTPDPDVVDKTALRTAVNAAATTDHTAYADEALNTLDKALADGQRALADDSLDQAGVDAAAKAITDAIAALGDKLDPLPVNAAANATPKASYETTWNRLAAVNDGEVSFTPTGNTDADNPKVWGTWSASNPEQQWVEYDWSDEVTLNRASLYFWYDNTATGTASNVPLPKGWKLQYWDAAAGDGTGDWADVALADGGTYTVNRDAASTVAFKPVTTTKLRAVIDADGDGTNYAAIAVSEFAVYAAPADIDVPVTSVTVNGADVKDGRLALKVGGASKFSAAIEPADATNQQVTWTSSDENVATVDENGVVTAKGEGEAEITATSVSDPTIAGKVAVTVGAADPVPTPADKTALDKLIADIESKQLDASQYTDESWKVLTDALAEAKQVSAADNATQQQVDDALSALQTAWDGLTARPEDPDKPGKVDTSALQAAVDAAAKLAQGDYTVASWAQFAAALSRAQAVLADKNATQADVDAALDALNQARSALVKAEPGQQPGEPGGPGEPGEPGQSGQPGDHAGQDQPGNPGDHAGQDQPGNPGQNGGSLSNTGVAIGGALAAIATLTVAGLASAIMRKRRENQC